MLTLLPRQGIILVIMRVHSCTRLSVYTFSQLTLHLLFWKMKYPKSLITEYEKCSGSALLPNPLPSCVYICPSAGEMSLLCEAGKRHITVGACRKRWDCRLVQELPGPWSLPLMNTFSPSPDPLIFPRPCRSSFILLFFTAILCSPHPFYRDMCTCVAHPSPPMGRIWNLQVT